MEHGFDYEQDNSDLETSVSSESEGSACKHIKQPSSHDYISSLIVEVDERFSHSWRIPFEAVLTQLHWLDTYWDRHPGAARQGGLISLCAPGAADYANVVMEIAKRCKKENTTMGTT